MITLKLSKPLIFMFMISLIIGCNKNSKALKLAKKSRTKNNYGKRKVPKIKLKLN